MMQQPTYVRVTAQLPPELAATLAERAKANRRSFSAEVVTVLERALGEGEVAQTGSLIRTAKGHVAAGEKRAPGYPEVAETPLPSSPSPSVSRSGRTRTCDHRIPATAFCKVCDS